MSRDRMLRRMNYEDDTAPSLLDRERKQRCRKTRLLATPLIIYEYLPEKFKWKGIPWMKSVTNERSHFRRAHTLGKGGSWSQGDVSHVLQDVRDDVINHFSFPPTYVGERVAGFGGMACSGSKPPTLASRSL
ncbi:hypothetical protein NPIL_584191 [Nephila pilipes]|uniref:Uncharacterized protein n=1 Tax=Nephila pilipes TaxID=299642 RepID=A0A8X6MMX4_NEPPI|nr:hypothetical protein NPIL_584191 [Nephila pilipes]